MGIGPCSRMPSDDALRADILRGLAEASARLDRGKEAIAAASEAARIYAAAGREADAALARYWLAYGLYQSDNEVDARSVLTALLEQVRGGLHVEPDFEMRLLTSLAAVESRAGQASRALAYLEEARGLAADLDDRRRAAFLFNLAINYREVGDFEAAIRAGTQGMALYRAAGAIFESARIENDLALAYLASGQVDRARELATDARRQIEETGDERWMAAVVDTEAQVALADRRRRRGAAPGQRGARPRRPQRQRVQRPDGDADRGPRSCGGRPRRGGGGALRGGSSARPSEPSAKPAARGAARVGRPSRRNRRSPRRLRTHQ